MTEVVAAIIEKDEKVLLCQRGPGGNCPFLWEFPGGKIEKGENPFDALKREIKEELSADAEPFELFDEFTFSYPEKDIHFYFIKTRLLSDELSLLVHKDAKWMKKGEKTGLEFCPADVPVAEKLFETEEII